MCARMPTVKLIGPYPFFFYSSDRNEPPQPGVIGFHLLFLTVFAYALNPTRTAKIFAEHAPQSFSYAVEFQLNKLIDPQREVIAFSKKCAQPSQLRKSGRGHAYGLAIRSKQRMSPLGLQGEVDAMR
jgi:hypothetical protein